MARFQVNEANFADMAASGNSEVMYELGLMYASGRNGEFDKVAAHKWFNLAAYRGLERAKANREDIAMEMTSQEISA
ncbi:MAG: sel1 repeat family protein, partial [Nitratireductor sp.]